MTVSKSVLLSHIFHFGENRIRCDSVYDTEIISTIRSIKSARWSSTLNCWHIEDDKRDLKKLIEKLEKISIVRYKAMDQDIELNKINEHRSFMADPFAEYSSLFISYSFKDKNIVSRINDSLIKNGVNTFLWEKDAPFGETLKNIMFENIHKYDRVLFVASENSIKSDACQYELTQTREKQDKLWKTVLFPIHIDNFLFELRKENIRPKEKAIEYWLNICELRNINSLDFTELSKDFNKELFEDKIKTLLNNLICN